MRGHIRKRVTWEYVVELGDWPAQRCMTCSRRFWVERRKKPRCPKCGGELNDTVERRQRCQAQREEGKNPRAAVEATVRQVKHPFRAGKLPVRGLYRVQNLLVGAASMVNIRRIACYQRRQTPGRASGGSADRGRRGEEAGGISLRLRLGYLVHSLLCLWGPPQLVRA